MSTEDPTPQPAEGDDPNEPGITQEERQRREDQQRQNDDRGRSKS